ncbi:winged helix-turn-helix domain-containing protein [Salmonella enterica]|nr:winged helix-turn-helix domain-containing protein [Salmonella enterica]
MTPVLISAFVARTWKIVFRVPGMNKCLHRNGFTNKKPSGLSHNSEEKNNK